MILVVPEVVLLVEEDGCDRTGFLFFVLFLNELLLSVSPVNLHYKKNKHITNQYVTNHIR